MDGISESKEQYVVKGWKLVFQVAMLELANWTLIMT